MNVGYFLLWKPPKAFLSHSIYSNLLNNMKKNLQICSFSFLTTGLVAYQIYMLQYSSEGKQQIEVEPPISKIISTIVKQEYFYRQTGEFSDNVNDYLYKPERRINEYLMKIKLQKNNIFISVFCSQNSVSYSAFGIVEAVNSKLNFDIDKSKKIRQYTEIKSFACNAEKPDTPLPSNLDITNIDDKCPVGYTQVYKKQS